MSDQSGTGGSAPAKGVSRETLATPRPRRFYTLATLGTAAADFSVALDGRSARTPGKKLLAVPTRALAAALIAEWNAQGREILAETMPLTRLANTVIDGVIGNEAAVRADILAFSRSDLVCYRAAAPEGLCAAQSHQWDPVLAYARDRLGAGFLTRQGIIHIAQPPDAIERVADAIDGLDAWQLAALHQMTTLTGSALLALATLMGELTVAQAWQAAHVDEDWQISRWGEDAEATARREFRWRDMQAAAELARLAQPPRG